MMLRRLPAGFGDAVSPAGHVFAPSVEAWRSPLEAYAGDLPINFLLRWIEQESGGNVCSFTSLHESGIFQLMPPPFSTDTDIAGTTETELRTACVPGSQQLDHPPTEDEKKIQVTSGVKFVNSLREHAHTLLDQAGANWPETSADFWSLVRLLHALPAPAALLPAYTQQNGRPPATFADFADFVSGCCGRSDVSHWTSVSADDGAFGAGGGRVLAGSRLLIGVAIVGLILGAYFVHTAPGRRIAHQA